MRIFESITDFFNDFAADPGKAVIGFLYLAVCILLSLILHECAHGWVALKCGDPTAKMMGRLTLDPRKHLDPVGTVCMVFLHFGWAKPVPVNPRNFRNYRRDMILVSLAGIIMNLMICMVSLFISALLAKAIWHPEFVAYLSDTGTKTALINPYDQTTVRLINLIPYYEEGKMMNVVSSFDGYGGFVFSAAAISNGSFEFFSGIANGESLMYIQRFFLMLAQINLSLAVFNLLPVPPLDGFRVADQFLFRGELRMTQQTMQYIYIGFMILLLTGALTGLLTTVNSAVMGWFTSLFAMLI